MEDNQSEKIQKVLARIGLGSRREIESWIAAGRINVNGQKAKLGDRITGKDKLSLDGKLIKQEKTKARILIYNKPTGIICSRKDPEGRENVFKHLPKIINGRWVMIGRLDINSSGLLLFTNDGELAQKMMHPSYQIEREYAVRVLGKLDRASTKRLLDGVKLEDGVAHFDEIKDMRGQGVNHWYNVVLKEGKNREVRRLFESQGLTVNRLIRVRYGKFQLPSNLPPGDFREVDYRVDCG